MTKKQQAQLDRFTQRITDIYSGVIGENWDDELVGCITANQYSTIQSVVWNTFELDDEWNKKCRISDSFSVSMCFLRYFESPSKLAKWLFELGVRG